MLLDILNRDRCLGPDRFIATRALKNPWCWPSNPELVNKTQGHDFSAPLGPPPGETLLVSATEDQGRQALWRLYPGSPGALPPSEQVSFIKDAAASAGEAHACLTRKLPLVVIPGRISRAPAWQASRIFKEGQGRDLALDGESFGLSFLLAGASLAMDTPLPADLAASAAIRADGELCPVGALEQKLPMLLGAALGVRRLLVAAKQEEEARESVRALGGEDRLEIIGVSDLEAMYRVAFEPEQLEAHPRWQDLEQAEQDAGTLFHFALDMAQIPDWSGVAAAGAILASHLKGRTVPVWQASAAAAIAQRHQDRNRSLPPLTSETKAALHTHDLYKYQAQLIQSHNDACTGELPRLLDACLSKIKGLQSYEEAMLEMMGAAGRAKAALGLMDEAAELAQLAVDEWMARRRYIDASYPLAELIRVQGLRDGQDLPPRLLQIMEAFFMETDPERDQISHGFIHLAMGRTRVLLDQPKRALAHLSDEATVWARLPDHLRFCKERWEANALDLLGRHDEADKLRRALSREHGDPKAALFSRLDLAIRDRNEPSARAALDELTTLLGPDMVARYAPLEQSLLERASALALKYPY